MEEFLDSKCPVCNDSKIETARIQEPDGEGGFEWVNEDRPCSACQ